MAIRASDVPYAWIRRELVFQGDIRRGQKGRRVEFVQEMATLQGFRTGIDGDYGPATAEVVGQFQVANGVARTGVVDEETFSMLIQPLLQSALYQQLHRRRRPFPRTPVRRNSRTPQAKTFGPRTNVRGPFRARRRFGTNRG